MGVLLAVSFAACSSGDPAAPAAEVSAPPTVQAVALPAVQIVTLDEKQAAELNIETVTASLTEARFPLSMPGTVYPAPENVAIVSAPISGRVVSIRAHEGEFVRKGQVVAEIESLEFAGLTADYLQARADARYAEQQAERLRRLVERKISPEGALEKAQADEIRAGAAVQAAASRLRALGVAAEGLEGENVRPLLPIRAPISGIINEHLIDLGQAVTAYEKMLGLVNLDQVLVRGYVSPEDASLVEPGDAVTIRLKNFPDDVLSARVATINPALDEANKSVTVNILARTANRRPLPGQSVRVDVLVASPLRVLVLPLSAVQYEGDQATVFVKKSPLSFEKRVIRVSRVLDDAVMVAEGVAEGEEVAASQVFSLKALGRYEQYAAE